jgi:hypothetical protein
MSEQDRYQSFEEFWPFYVREHRKQTTRVMHFVGTTAAMACVAGALLTKRRWLLAVAPFAGYGPAWFSHFFIEKNRPATFTYPLWSLRADLVMWSKMVRGQMSAEVERVLAAEEAKASERAAQAAQATQATQATPNQGEAVN